MSKKLDSVRRSLFQEFDDSAHDDSFGKLGNSSHQKTSSKRTTSIKINSTAIAIVVILSVAIAVFSKFHRISYGNDFDSLAVSFGELNSFACSFYVNLFWCALCMRVTN